MVQILILRELKARYRGTALGFLWSFVNPLVLMVVYVWVFSVYFRVDMEHYSVFLLSGILPWNCFSSGLNEATNSIISNGGLIKKVYLPSEMFPLVYVASNMVHYLLSIPILLLFLIFFGIKLSWPLLFFPWILSIQLLFTYGLALIVSSLAVQFRDLLHVVPNFLMIWFFVTPILYPVGMVPERYRPVVKFNPMAQLITAYQDMFFSNRIPSMASLMILTGLSVAFLAIGLAVFGARRDVFAEEV
ncbi:MAG: ABC transporter permease [Candidatus Rokubacteria bacterium]|nr:ABC transporter permease [Candidatus Rokubacteria bacterium]